MLNLIVAKKGDAEIPGLTEGEAVRRLGPKRASKIRKMFDLSKEDKVQDFVNKREAKVNGDKKNMKAPKIQRLVTAKRLQRKRRVKKTIVKKLEANRTAKAAYLEKMAAFRKETKDKRHTETAKKKTKKAQK